MATPAPTPWATGDVTTGTGCCGCGAPPDADCNCAALAAATYLCMTVSGGPSSGPTDSNKTRTLTKVVGAARPTWTWAESPPVGLPGFNSNTMTAVCAGGLLYWYSYHSFGQLSTCAYPPPATAVESWASQCTGVIAVTAGMCGSLTFTGSAGTGSSSYRSYNAGCPASPGGPVSGYYDSSQGGAVSITVGACGGVMAPASMMAVAPAADAARCRHRPADPVNRAEAASLGLNPMLDWFRCGRTPLPLGLITGDATQGLATTCTTCGLRAGRLCGTTCDGYAPADDDPPPE